MIILGKDERLKLPRIENYSRKFKKIYDETQTYHDGKWMMFEPIDTSLFDDFIRLLNMIKEAKRRGALINKCGFF